MAKIKRYTCGAGEGMFEERNGHWVEWSEYQKLNSEMQRLLLQANVLSLRAVLVQMHSDAMQQLPKVQNWNQDENIRADMEALRRVIWLIDAQYPPVA
jgi:hypothetical protein